MSPSHRFDLWGGSSSDSHKQTLFDTIHTQTKQHSHRKGAIIYSYQRSSVSHESSCCSSFHVSTTTSSSKENSSFPPCFGSKNCWDILSVAPDEKETSSTWMKSRKTRPLHKQETNPTAHRNFRKALQCDGGEKPNVSVRLRKVSTETKTRRFFGSQHPSLVGSPPPPADVSGYRETLCVGNRVLHNFTILLDMIVNKMGSASQVH